MAGAAARRTGWTIEHEEAWPHGGHSLYFRDPAGQLRRADHAGTLGPAVGMVSACDRTCVAGSAKNSPEESSEWNRECS